MVGAAGDVFGGAGVSDGLVNHDDSDKVNN